MAQQFFKLALAVVSLVQWGDCYNVPQARVALMSPQGFEVSVPDAPGISLFAFHGKVNAPMKDLRDQTWAEDVLRPENGRWIYRNGNQKLQPGDTLHYWTTVRHNGVDQHRYSESYRVHGSTDSPPQKIDLEGSNGAVRQIVVNGNPTINIHVS